MTIAKGDLFAVNNQNDFGGTINVNSLHVYVIILSWLFFLILLLDSPEKLSFMSQTNAPDMKYSVYVALAIAGAIVIYDLAVNQSIEASKEIVLALIGFAGADKQ